jgi:hypothetical protein
MSLGKEQVSLSNSDPRNGAMTKVGKGESREIRALLGESVLRRPSSVELGWKNVAVEHRTSSPGEKSEFMSENHFLILWRSYVAEGEIADQSGRFSPLQEVSEHYDNLSSRHQASGAQSIQARNDCRCAPPGLCA